MRRTSTARTEPVAAPRAELNAVNLKETLWDTLNAIKQDIMLPGQGDAIAGQAREILRTVKVQLQVANQSKRPVPQDVIRFTESLDK